MARGREPLAHLPCRSDDRADMAELRIATFNLENLDWNAAQADAFERRRAALLPALEALGADVLCLQEINAQRRHIQGPREFLALDRLLAGTRYERFHRAASVRPGGKGPADVHNLAILSRWPFTARRQLHHDLVQRWHWPPPKDGDVWPPPIEIAWDRPLLHAAVALPAGRTLHVVNLHLRAPRPAPVPTARGVGSSRAVIEGQFVAALKREGQALEARLLAETIFDAEPDALLAICGDFNADEHDAPTRLMRGARDEQENHPRALFALEERVAPERRHTVIHAGAPKLIDHILASRALASAWRESTILNDGLEDEVYAPDPVEGSLHAPVVARFGFD